MSRVAAGALALFAGVAASGCSSPPPAAASNLRLSPREEAQRWTLDDGEERVVRQTLASLAEGHVPVDPPHPAPLGKRFGDVERAVALACDDVEAVVMAREEAEDGSWLRFRLRTIEDWPGELRVEKAEGPVVYRAEAWFGRFPDEPKCRRRTQALLDALEIRLRELGRKRGWEEAG